jgi:hypothetical protein
MSGAERGYNFSGGKNMLSMANLFAKGANHYFAWHITKKTKIEWGQLPPMACTLHPPMLHVI